MEEPEEILSEEVDCPFCGTYLKLYPVNRIEKQFVCPECDQELDFTEPHDTGLSNDPSGKFRRTIAKKSDEELYEVLAQIEEYTFPFLELVVGEMHSRGLDPTHVICPACSNVIPADVERCPICATRIMPQGKLNDLIRKILLYFKELVMNPSLELGLVFVLFILGQYIAGTIVVALIGLWWTGWGVAVALEAGNTKYWSETEGKVLTSVLDEIGSGMGMRTRANIVYKYRVDGHEYKSSRIFWGDTSSLSIGEGSLQERLVDDYRKGKRVQVYYNPEWPYQSVLEPGVKFRQYAVVIGGIILLLVAGVIASRGALL